MSYYLGLCITFSCEKIVFCVYNCGIESFLILIFFLWRIKLTTNAIINLVRQRWLIFLNFFFFLSTVSYVKLANDQRCHQDGRQAIRRSYFWKQQTAPVTEDDTGVEGPNDKDCAASLILPQMFIKQESTKISLACY